MIITKRHKGVYAANETGVEIMPKYYKRDGSKTGVLLLHGYQDTDQTAFLKYVSNKQTQIAYALAEAGHPCFAPLAGGDALANDTAIARVTDAYNYLTTKLGAKPDKIILFGLSMGGGTSMVWARANPDKVKALVLAEPMSDLNDVVVNNRAGLGAVVNAAYGGAYDNAVHGPTHNPEVFKAQLAQFPAQVWYATEDTTVVPSTVQSVIAGAGWTDVHTVPGNHGSSMYNQIDIPTVVNFVLANA